MNGSVDGRGVPGQKVIRNYKLLVDPFLVKSSVKVFRFEGIIPGDPLQPPVIPRDPRNPLARLKSRLEPHDIPVPR